MTGDEHAREAEQALDASTWQRQQWGEDGIGDDALKAAMWEMGRALVHAVLALHDTPRTVATPKRDPSSSTNAVTERATPHRGLRRRSTIHPFGFTGGPP